MDMLWTSSAARLVGDGVHLDLGADHRTRFDSGAGQYRILELFSEYPVVAPEVADILEVGGDAHDVGEGRAFFRENPANGFDRAPRLLLDRSRDHVAIGVLRNLARDKMKSPARTAGWNGKFGFFFPIG